MEQLNLNTELKVIFSNVNDWLKFAEAKNAALITFNCLVFFGVFKLRNANDSFHLINIFLYIQCFFLSLSTLISLLSFFPKTQIESFFFTSDTESISEKDNLLFFGDISKYNSSKYLESILKALDISNHSSIKMHNYFIEQIIQNSIITQRKYSMFKIAILTTTISFLLPVLMILFYLINS